MFDMGGLYNDLTDCLGKPIDLVTTQTLEQSSTRTRTPQFVENLYRERLKLFSENSDERYSLSCRVL
jgi:hypothetical protein